MASVPSQLRLRLTPSSSSDTLAGGPAGSSSETLAGSGSGSGKATPQLQPPSPVLGDDARKAAKSASKAQLAPRSWQYYPAM